jgi:hypothetical protein
MCDSSSRKWPPAQWVAYVFCFSLSLNDALQVVVMYLRTIVAEPHENIAEARRRMVWFQLRLLKIAMTALLT